MVSVELRKEIEQVGLTLTLIGTKYRNVVERSRDREVVPPLREEFYQSFITQFKEYQHQEEYENLTVAQLFHKLDIHSPNTKSYIPFLLLPREVHKALHAEEKRKQNILKWEDIRRKGELQCKTCSLIKGLEEFTKDNRAHLGISQPCRACKSKRAKKLKEAS